MNRFHHLLLLALLGLITACSYNELPENLSPLTIENNGLVLQVETRAETYKGQSLDQEYFVTAADLENFVKYRRSASKRSDLTVKEVKSYGFDSSQTLFYILNYDQGWEVISADKRIQPTLAHGDSGEFTMDCDNEAMKLWMNMLADGVLQMRLGNFEKEGEEATASAESKDSADEPTSDHTAFWDAISHTNTSRTRFEPLVPIPGPFDSLITITPTYKYYLPHLTETFTESTYYGPYIQTSWGQDYPWNQCCPDMGSLLHSDYAKVGCAAVATGQMLYYLQDKYNLDIIAYENVICILDLMQSPPVYRWNEIGESTELWDDMATYYYKRDGVEHTDGNVRYVAALLSKLGDYLFMHYGLNMSYIYDSNAVSQCFEYIYNISCINDYDGISYSVTTVENQLKNNEMPVVIYALQNQNYNGHMWIIDGCYTYERVFRKYYLITSTAMDPSSLVTITKEEASGYEDTIQIGDGDTFHMNWGEGGSYNGWYAKSIDVWELNSENSFSPTQAKIIYNFTPQN